MNDILTEIQNIRRDLGIQTMRYALKARTNANEKALDKLSQAEALIKSAVSEILDEKTDGSF